MWEVHGESVSMERLDGETILINFDSGEYFSFRESSADILWLICAGVDVEKWPVALEAAFPGLVCDETVHAEIGRFLGQLAEAGIIVSSKAAGAEAVPLPDDYIRGEWTAPSVHANDDLVDLLVIDPIHDASDDGWPQTTSH